MCDNIKCYNIKCDNIKCENTKCDNTKCDNTKCDNTKCNNTKDLNEFIARMLIDVMIPLIKDIDKFYKTVELNAGSLYYIIDFLNTLSLTTAQTMNDILLGINKIGLLSNTEDRMNLYIYNTFISNINIANCNYNPCINYWDKIFYYSFYFENFMRKSNNGLFLEPIIFTEMSTKALEAEIILGKVKSSAEAVIQMYLPFICSNQKYIEYCDKIKYH